VSHKPVGLEVSGAWQREVFARRSALELHLTALRQHQAIA